MTRASDPRLLALHGLRLKGTADAHVVADTVGACVERLRSELDALETEGLVTFRQGRLGGYQLTEDGRAVGARMLAGELDEHGVRDEVEDAYRRFRTFNGDLLEVCTAWQLRPVGGTREPNDHTDATYDAGVRQRLLQLDAQVRPVLDQLCAALARFDGHRRRLRFARERVLSGDSDYFTRPMFPSYHSVWFELHEDLLATLGTDRRSEGSL